MDDDCAYEHRTSPPGVGVPLRNETAFLSVVIYRVEGQHSTDSLCQQSSRSHVNRPSYPLWDGYIDRSRICSSTLVCTMYTVTSVCTHYTTLLSDQ